MNEGDIVTYSEIRDLKNEKDVLERILIEKTQKCDEIGRKYYNQQKEQILETIKYNSNKSNDINYKQRVINLKKAQRDLERLCSHLVTTLQCLPLQNLK